MDSRIERRWNAVSLRTKMTGVSVLLLTVGLLVAGIGSMQVLRSYLTSETDAKIALAIKQLNNSILQIKDSTEGIDCSVSSVPTEFYIAVFTSTGTVVCENKTEPSAHPEKDAVSATFLEPDQVLFTVANAPTIGQWRVIAVPQTLPESGSFVYIVVGLSLNETDALIARYAAIFLFFGLTVVILGGALTRLLVTTTFTPLREVEATAARFAAGDFSQRLGGATPNTEVGRLNRSLNSMLARIDRAFADRAKTIDQMRRFVGDASHELRTPLVSVRGYAELYRMGAITQPDEVAQAMGRIEKEAIRMGELVEDLLELARIDEAKPLQLAQIDLIPLAHDAALDAMASSPERSVTVVVTVPETVEPEPTENLDTQPMPIVDAATEAAEAARATSLATGPIAFAGATLARLRTRKPHPTKDSATEVTPTAQHSTTPEPQALVWAEENKIRQVLTNLIGNAVRFTPSDSPIEIGVEIDASTRHAVLSVIDHGEGIPPQIREKIFQRFWRADSSRNRDTGGSGLGLAIVSSIVQAHKGAVEVVETPGGGATFRVLLPLLQEPALGPVAPRPSL
ncbi:MAG: sensor histidine kinase [Microbacteriaceae bacterium]